MKSGAEELYSFFAVPEILQKPGRPLPCPYLATYLPTLLWETKKEITRVISGPGLCVYVKVGYYTN